MGGEGVLALGISVIEAHGVDFDENFTILRLRHGCFGEAKFVEAVLVGFPLLHLCHFDEMEGMRGTRKWMGGRRDESKGKKGTLCRSLLANTMPTSLLMVSRPANCCGYLLGKERERISTMPWLSRSKLAWQP